MKKIQQVNGYAIYQATTQRDADNYNCEIGNYNIYLASDIRDYGLSNSYPEWENEDSLAVVLARCNGSQYAVACALADELSGSTAQDMDLVMEIERRLDAGEALNAIREELGPCVLDDGDDTDLGDMDVAFDHENWWDDPDLPESDDDLDGDLEDVLGAALEQGDLEDQTRAPQHRAMSCREWMLANRPDLCGSVFFGGCQGCPADHIPGAAQMGSPECDDAPSCQACWDRPVPGSTRPRSHASFAVLRDPDDGSYQTIAPPALNDTWCRTQHDADMALLSTVARHYAFSDCGGWDVEEIVIDGDHVEYAGWRPGMEFIFTNTRTGEIVFDVCYPEWDH